MRNATLVYSCKPGMNNILSYEGTSVTRLFNAILREKYKKSDSPRVTFKNNRYCYFPTDDYKNHLMRFRGVHKNVKFISTINELK